MRTQMLRLSAWLAVAALLPAAAVDAGGKKGTVSAAHAQLVSEIHQTRVLLQQANHDYAGFRAKAVHELGKAMHALDPHHKHKLPPSTNTGTSENQAASDAQLNQAGKQVQTLISQLSTGTATANRTTAMQHLQNAAGHLNTALKVK